MRTDEARRHRGTILLGKPAEKVERGGVDASRQLFVGDTVRAMGVY